MEKNNNLEILKNDLKKYFLFYNMENLKNNLKNSENNNLSIITMDNITEILKRKIDKQINTFVKHKATIKAFNNYINSLGNDKIKFKKINSQLANLSKSINTLPKLFKSFTSQKRSIKLNKLWRKKYYYLNYHQLKMI